MEIGTPTWNAGERSYSFYILKTQHTLENVIYYETSQQNIDLPATDTVTEVIITELLEKTKKYFTNPLTTEKVLRHLRHASVNENLPKKTGWYRFKWQPSCFTIKSNDFLLSWKVNGIIETEPLIPSEFTASTTPRAQSPDPSPEQACNLYALQDKPGDARASFRNIQIHDTLIPVGDLPLSDLPPLAFGMDELDPLRQETKRRVREARLKVQLAKLKAQRMEHKYYERYGTTAESSDDSSEFSSDSEGEDLEPSFGNHSH